jgi:hypothetical protein
MITAVGEHLAFGSDLRELGTDASSEIGGEDRSVTAIRSNTEFGKMRNETFTPIAKGYYIRQV